MFLFLLFSCLGICHACHFVDLPNPKSEPFCIPKSSITARLHQLLRSVTASSQPTEVRNGFTSQAIRAANSQDSKEAMALFRAAAYYKPGQTQMLSNLALTLRDTALELIRKRNKKTRKTAWRMLCESVAAYELVFYIKNKPIANVGKMQGEYALLEHVHKLLDQNYPKRCHSVGNCDRYKTIKKGMSLELLSYSSAVSKSTSSTTIEISSNGEEEMDWEEDDDTAEENEATDNALDGTVDFAEKQRMRHIQAVNLVCQGKDALKIKLEDSDRKRGTPSIFFARDIYAIMRICGAVAVPEVYSASDMTPIVAAQRQVLQDFMNHGDRSGSRGGNKVSEGGKIDGK